MSYPNCRACGFMVETTREPCRFCGHDPAEPVAEPKYPTPPPTATHRPAAPDDEWFVHFVRYLGISVLVGFLSSFVIGIFWTFAILSRAGYRKRDLLLFLVPVVNFYVGVTVFWRYTAKTAYWRPRLDRPSAPMAPSTRPHLVAAGYLVLPLYVWMSIQNFQTFLDRYKWTPAERTEFVDALRVQGFDGRAIECIADRVEAVYPGGPPRADDPGAGFQLQQAVTACDLPDLGPLVVEG